MSRKRCNTLKNKSSKLRRTEILHNIPDGFRNFSDVNESMRYLRDLFPIMKFDDRLPPIIFHHQIYGVMKNRTLVDKDIDKLRESCKVKLFKLSSNPQEVSLIFTEDYVNHIEKHFNVSNVPKHIKDIFVSKVVLHTPDMSLTKSQFADLGISESDIRLLIGISVLSVRDVGSWWLAAPNSGLFLNSLEKGRKVLTNLIRKTQFGGILLDDLVQRSFHRSAKLGLLYHLYDLIGADRIECIPTSSSTLFRLPKNIR